jgi:hypothetical protein
MLKKMGNNLPFELIQEDMITLQQIIVARAYLTLRQIRKYNSPREYAKNVLQQLQYRKTVPALFVVYDHKNVDTSYLYTPGEIRKRVIDEINSNISIDSDDVTTSSDLADDGDFYLSSKDMNKAIRLLEKEIGLINLKGKKVIKKNIVSKQKLELKGRPSVYKMPDIFAFLNKVCSDEHATRQVIKTLVSMGMLAALAFILEASFYAIKDVVNDGNAKRIDKLFKAATMLSTQTKVDMDIFRLHKEYIRSLDESKLGLLATNIANEWLNHPELYGYILISSLF